MTRTLFKPLAMVLSLLSASLPVAAQTPIRSTEISPPAPVVQVLERRGRLFAIAADRRQWRVDFTDAGVKFTPVAALAPALPPGGGMPDGIINRHRKSGLSAWLTHPTRRYDHGVLGDQIEAGGLRVVDGEGKVYDVALDDRTVFEDRMVRLWDIDGDDRPEFVVVRSGLESGAQLAAYGLRGVEIVEIASSPPIGRAYRWLNPVGAADFDGDGRIEVAAVMTPHLGALLRLFRLEGDRLEAVYEAAGFSNHGIGMRTLEMAVVLDVNGDGVADIVAPNAVRNAMRVVSFAGGVFRELGRATHQSTIAGDSVTFRRGSLAAVAYPLRNGKIAIIEFTKH